MTTQVFGKNAMSLTKLTDEELLTHFVVMPIGGDPRQRGELAAELVRRLKRNPRCPGCGAEQPTYAGLCGSCAEVPAEADRTHKEESTR